MWPIPHETPDEQLSNLIGESHEADTFQLEDRRRHRCSNRCRIRWHGVGQPLIPVAPGPGSGPGPDDRDRRVHDDRDDGSRCDEYHHLDQHHQHHGSVQLDNVGAVGLQQLGPFQLRSVRHCGGWCRWQQRPVGEHRDHHGRQLGCPAFAVDVDRQPGQPEFTSFGSKPGLAEQSGKPRLPGIADQPGFTAVAAVPGQPRQLILQLQVFGQAT